MHIDEGLHRFPKPTLLLAVDLHHGKGYLADWDSVENIFSIETPKEHYVGRDSGNSAEKTDLEAHVFHDHTAKLIAVELEKLLHQKKFDHLIVYIPGQLKNIFEKKMPPDVIPKITRLILADVTNETPIQLITRLTAKG